MFNKRISIVTIVLFAIAYNSGIANAAASMKPTLKSEVAAKPEASKSEVEAEETGEKDQANTQVIFFDSNTKQLNKYSVNSLDQNVLSQARNAAKIIIEGYCDERGSVAYNQKLAKKRAETVKNYLVKHGVKSAIIEIVSYGKSKPVDNSHKKTALTKNRRAVIVLVKKVLDKKITPLPASPAIASQPVVAQDNKTNSANFEGLNAAIGLSAVSYDTAAFVNDATAKSTSNYTFNSHNFVGIADLSYFKALSNSWLVGVGGTYDLHSANANKSDYTSSDGTYYSNLKITTRNHFSVYLQPTYALSNNIALFAKVGLDSTLYGMDDNHFILGSKARAYNKKIYGLDYGAGLITYLNQNIFVKLQTQIVNYGAARFTASDGSAIRANLNTISGIMSVGYKF